MHKYKYIPPVSNPECDNPCLLAHDFPFYSVFVLEDVIDFVLTDLKEID